MPKNDSTNIQSTKNFVKQNDESSLGRFEVAGYQIDVLIQGYPGKSTVHGGLGWSTVVLLQGHGHVVVLDAGSFGMRKPVINALKAHGFNPPDITDLLLSHAHHDHIVNFPMFTNARMLIGAHELEMALKEPWGTGLVPEVYVKELANWPSLRLIADSAEVLPHITAHLAPGHSPGHLIFVVAGEEHDVLLIQDAAKNRVELVSRRTDMTYDEAISVATIDKLNALWRKRPGSVLIPGHDLPMILENDRPVRIGARRAEISAVFGETLEETTTFKLSEI